jgi:biopolymer transport protein ExbB
MLRVIGLLAAIAVLAPAQAQVETQDQIKNLDQLLESVKQEQARQRGVNQQREAEFLADKRAQQRLLAAAKREFEQHQEQNQPLLAVTDSNAQEIDKLEDELGRVVGDIGDLSSTFREFAGDFAAVFQESMLSAQLGERAGAMQELASADTQVTIEEIQALWLLLQEDMTESGKVAQFAAPVIDTAGVARVTQVLRLGVFNAWDQGDYLRYVPETGELLTLSRQPPARFRDAARSLTTPSTEVYTLAIDPTRGNLLGMLSFTPDLRERVAQGGTIGMIIIALGVIGLLLTAWRMSYLLLVSRRIRRQLVAVASPTANNPLGRVLRAVEGIPIEQEELLQLKLDEAVLAEIPALERGNGLIKLLAATSPLLGLLGPVTGMILTFQAISLFGTGDPKLMAGGISQALVTTVLGLVVAIPLLFGHSVVAFLARATVQRLDEQCAGVLARSAEAQ